MQVTVWLSSLVMWAWFTECKNEEYEGKVANLLTGLFPLEVITYRLDISYYCTNKEKILKQGEWVFLMYDYD